MALTPSFTANGTANPSEISFVDTSTGSDGAVVGRKINIYDIFNNLLFSSPYDWPDFPGTTTLTINPLEKDIAANIVVTWVDSGGGVLYTASQIAVFTGYAEQFFYQLTQNQTGKPNLLNDNGYFENKSKLRTLIDGANQSIAVGNDIVSAQTSVDLYIPMLQNQDLYF